MAAANDGILCQGTTMRHYFKQAANYFRYTVLGETDTQDVEALSDQIELSETNSADIPVTPPIEISSQVILLHYLQFVFAKRNLNHILAASFLTCLGSGFNFLAPYLFGALISAMENDSDPVVAGIEMSQTSVIASLVMIYALSQMVPNCREQVLASVAAFNTKELLLEITKHQLDKSLDYHINHSQSSQMYLLQKGYFVANTSTPLLTQVAPTLLEMIIAVIILSAKYGPLMGINITTTFSLYLAYCAVTTKPIVKAKEDMLIKNNCAWEKMSDVISQYKIIHDFNRVSETMVTVEALTTDAARSETNAVRRPLQIGLGHITISRMGMLTGAIYAGFAVTRQQYSIPDFVALFGYLNQLSFLVPFAGQSINYFFASYPDIKFVFSELAKPAEIIDEHPDAPLVIHEKAIIRFDNVSFSYPKKKEETEKPIIFKNLSFIVEAGQTVGLVSRSGGGKSTLFNLLNRYYEPDSGKIFIDEQDITLVSRKSLQQSIGLVSQSPNLFNGTIRENICFGANQPSDVTDESILALADQLKLTDFLNSLSIADKQGLDVSTGEGGKALSGGQQQKVAILRGFMKKAPIRLLDEITAALDARSAKEVLKGVKALSKATTTLVITHKLQEVIDADKIIVLDKGCVIAEGKHSELLESCELYKQLWIEQHKKMLKSHSASSLISSMKSGGIISHSPESEPHLDERNNVTAYSKNHNM